MRLFSTKQDNSNNITVGLNESSEQHKYVLAEISILQRDLGQISDNG
jgi:hypothetical protein